MGSDGTSSGHFIANLLQSMSMKEFRQRSIFDAVATKKRRGLLLVGPLCNLYNRTQSVNNCINYMPRCIVTCCCELHAILGLYSHSAE